MHSIAARSLKRFLEDQCRIFDATSGAATLNETTFEVTFPPEAILYEGACDVQVAQRSRDADEGGGEDVRLSEYVVHIPEDGPAPRPGSVILILESDDQSLIGVEVEVVRAETATSRGLRSLIARRRRAFGQHGDLG